MYYITTQQISHKVKFVQFKGLLFLPLGLHISSYIVCACVYVKIAFKNYRIIAVDEILVLTS